VTKRGIRFEATLALSMVVRQQFGHLSAGAARCNTERLIEKNGFRSPRDARVARLDTKLRRAS
jgi:hypothetical protein